MTYGTTTAIDYSICNYRSRDYGNNTYKNIPAVETRVSRSGTNTRGYFTTKSRDLPENGFSLLSTKFVSTVGMYLYKESGREQTFLQGILRSPAPMPYYAPFYTAITNFLEPTAGEMSAVDGVARNKVRNAIKDQHANIAQIIAEREQTLNLIANTVIRIARAASQLKQGNLAKAAEHLGGIPSRRGRKRFSKAYRKDATQAVGSAWLELQYGWLPLLSDVRGLAEQLASIKSQEIRCYATAGSAWSNSRSVSTYRPGSTPSTTNDNFSSRYAVRYTVYFAMDLPSLNLLSQVGLTNPLQLAWELVPFSFVVDWIYPLGNALSALDATAGLRFVKGSKTVYRKYQSTRTSTGSYGVNAATHTWDFGSSAEQVLVDRTVLTSFPSTAMPEPKNPFSLVHCMNALALLSQTFKR